MPDTQQASPTGSIVRTLAGGVLLGALVAAIIAAWAWAGDRPECSGEMFACVGEVLVVAFVGVPVAVVLGWLGLRALRVPLPGVPVAVAVMAGIGLPALLDPPLWAWPAVVGALAAISIALVDRAA